MRIVLDTNVFVSGVFFGGVPGRILDAWQDSRVQLVLSAEILEEYQRVGQVLVAQYPGPDLEPFWVFSRNTPRLSRRPHCPSKSPPIRTTTSSWHARSPRESLSSSRGDKDLLDQSGWLDVRVLRPRQFADEFLSEK